MRDSVLIAIIYLTRKPGAYTVLPRKRVIESPCEPGSGGTGPRGELPREGDLLHKATPRRGRGTDSGGRGPTFQRVGYCGDGDSFGIAGDGREVAAADEDGAEEMNDEECLEQRDARATGFRSAGSRRRCPPYPLCRKGRLSLQDRAGGSGPGIEIPAPGGRRPCTGKHGERRRLRRLWSE